MIGSQETSRQTDGRHSAAWHGAGSRQRGGSTEALTLEGHSRQLLEGWVLFQGIWFGLVDNRESML